jgi:hypothetical protein
MKTTHPTCLMGVSAGGARSTVGKVEKGRPFGLDMQSKRSAGKRGRWLFPLAVLAAGGVGIGYTFVYSNAAAEIKRIRPPDGAKPAGSGRIVSVEVISPRPGGIDRLVTTLFVVPCVYSLVVASNAGDGFSPTAPHPGNLGTAKSPR